MGERGHTGNASWVSFAPVFLPQQLLPAVSGRFSSHKKTLRGTHPCPPAQGMATFEMAASWSHWTLLTHEVPNTERVPFIVLFLFLPHRVTL